MAVAAVAAPDASIAHGRYDCGCAVTLGVGVAVVVDVAVTMVAAILVAAAVALYLAPQVSEGP